MQDIQELRLGRVQGGGFFVSAIIPDAQAESITLDVQLVNPKTIQPMIGDAILFADCGIRIVEARTAETVTCGKKIISTKGQAGKDAVFSMDGDVMTITTG